MGFKGQLGKLMMGKGPAQPAQIPVAAPVPAVPTVAPWDPQRFRVQLNLAKNRIELQRGKKLNEMDLSRRNIAKLLSEGKEPMARIHCERLLRERAHVQAFDVLQTFVEILKNSHTVFVSVRDFDAATSDIKESVASVVYSASRVNVQELRNVCDMFRNHFGANIIDPMVRLEGVHVKCINNVLAVNLEGGTPDSVLIQQEMVKIAAEFKVDWTPPPDDTATGAYFPGTGGYGGGGGGGGYAPPMPYMPSNIPGYAPQAPPSDPYGGSYAPANIPGGDPFGASLIPSAPPSAPPSVPPSEPPSAPPPFDPSGGATGTLYPTAPPGDYASMAPPPPGANMQLPPPPPSFLSDDALEAKFRHMKDN